jgi:transcriptional regulator GlxA family with amidase domain
VKKIGYLLLPDFQVMLFGGLSVFELANQSGSVSFYDIRLISEKGKAVKCSLGYSVSTDSFEGAVFDTVIVGGALQVTAVTPGVTRFLNQALNSSRRVASMCTGAFYRAQAGLLDGRRVTTHWAYARRLQSTYPKVNVDEDRIFMVDGPVWTAAGMSAGADLALAMVERDLGRDVARLVARKLVMFQRRAGGQLQHSALLDLEARTERIQRALTYAKNHLQTALTVEQLAEAAHLSPRQFSRAFRAETGRSPAKAIETLRVEAARALVEQGRLPIEAVAREVGFMDKNRMRRAFLRAFGQPPQAIQRNAAMQ